MCKNDQNKIKVSVIIPVWNPGPGISRCIDSLRNQTLSDIEMIFVDDCGTDDSMDQVRAVAKDDFRIRIIENEENIGAGASRNRGIEAAQGEYLSFVDPDDYVALDFLELLYTEACKSNADIVKGTIVFEKEDGSQIQRKRNSNQTIMKMLAKGTPIFYAFTGEHQSAIYRRNLTESGLARYGSSTRGEDSTFLLRVGFQAESFENEDSAHYYLCERKDSAINTADVTRQDGALKAIQEQIDFILQYLPGNKWGEKRLMRRFVFYINEAEKYEKGPETEALLSDYAQNLRLELLRLPCHVQLAEQSFPIYVLKKHVILLPNVPHFSKWDTCNLPTRYAKLAEQWVDYYMDNPEEKNICKNDLAALLAHAKIAIKIKPFLLRNKLKYSDEKELLRNQIRRLPANDRIYIIIIEMKEILKAFAVRSLPINCWKILSLLR